MHKNFYLFAQLIKELKSRVLGYQIDTAFTYRKNELVLTLNSGLFLRLSVAPDQPYFLISKQSVIKQPVLKLFPELKDQTILNISLLNFDKHLLIETENFRLEVVFYGNFNNIFLFDKEEKLISTFKDRLEYPETATNKPEKFALNSIERKVLEDFAESNPDQSIFTFLKKNFAALSNLLFNEILFRIQLSADLKLSDLNGSQKQRLIDVLVKISEEINSGTAYLYFKPDNERINRISVIPLLHLEDSEKLTSQRRSSLNDALSVFYREKQFVLEFERLQSVCSKALSTRLNYLRNSVEKLKKNSDLTRRKEEAELKANLLLTFKNQIPKGAREVELENIFSEEKEKIKIKLNPSRSVVANAERYFNKFKRLNEEKNIQEIKLSTYQKEIKEIEQLITDLNKIKDLDRLRKFSRKLKEIKLIQKTAAEADRQIPSSNLRYSFKRLILNKTWDVYIGKDGENNDLLTFRFANKWDIWLHAQGVTGAHVIIRVPKKDQLPPHHIIEQAAQIAAANRTAKHSSTVSVIYTQARYVSRIRKAPPGTVKVQNEKVIFVKPLEIK